ncbi:MAG: FkbM family methyltransferase [Verrucomicrobiota bacterium]
MSDPGFPEFNELTDFRFGRILYNKNDIYIGKSLELYGEFSHGEVHLFEAVVKPGMTIVEVGANIGAHTVCLAQMAGLKGRVHAFEPQRVVYQTLCANVALNHLTNVLTYYAAAGDEAGELIVPELNPRNENNFGGLGLGGYEEGRTVPVVTVDSLNLPACHFIKADVEGMEEAALRGAEETILRFRPVLYVENDRKEKSADLERYIHSLGYRMFHHCPPLFSPENFKGNSENVFPNIVSKNLLCFHESTPSSITGLAEVEVPETGG